MWPNALDTRRRSHIDRGHTRVEVGNGTGSMDRQVFGCESLSEVQVVSASPVALVSQCSATREVSVGDGSGSEPDGGEIAGQDFAAV